MENNLPQKPSIHDMMNSAFNIEMLPALEKHKLELSNSFHIDKNVLGSLGTGSGSLASVLSQISTAGGEGLYRVTFPNGISGTLARTHVDGKCIGTIMNENGIAGQARLTQVPLDPTQLFMVVALAQINMKLDAIQRGQEDIIDFLEQDKKSQLTTDLNTLSEIYSTYQYNWDNPIFLSAKVNAIQDIKREADKNIDFYKNRLESSFNKAKTIHTGFATKELLKKSIENLRYYQLSLYNYAFSSFTEVMFLQNFTGEYLKKISGEIEKRSYDYREIYTQCYNFLDNYSKKSIDSLVLKGTGSISRKLGTAIANNNILSKGPVDEALLGASDRIERLTDADFRKSMEKLAENKDHGVRGFVESLQKIDQTYNAPLTLVVSDGELYLAS